MMEIPELIIYLQDNVYPSGLQHRGPDFMEKERGLSLITRSCRGAYVEIRIFTEKYGM
jgi:hypothetical protein